MARTEVTGSQIKDATVSLTADVTGTLPVANGGTGNATNTLNSVLVGNGTGAVTGVAPGASGNVLASNGTSWASTAPPAYSPGGTDVAVADGGTGVSTLTGIVKGNGTSAFSAATAGTDYVAPGGALGTPSSGTLTNCTGLPTSGLGTGKVEGSANGTPTSLTLWKGTAAQYTALGAGRPSTTIYIVTP